LDKPVPRFRLEDKVDPPLAAEEAEGIESPGLGQVAKYRVEVK